MNQWNYNFCRLIMYINWCTLRHVAIYTVFQKSKLFDVWQYLWQMWTYFQNSFTRWFVRKFSMYTSHLFPSHLQYVATLPCESRKSKNATKFSRWTWQLHELICLTKIWHKILRNLPQKDHTNDFTWICVQHMKYSVERTKTTNFKANKL